MSATLLPLNHPRLVRHELLGHEYGNRADVLSYHAQFMVDTELAEAQREIAKLLREARWHFSRRAELADWREPEVVLSFETLETLRRIREGEAERLGKSPASFHGGFIPQHQGRPKRAA